MKKNLIFWSVDGFDELENNNFIPPKRNLSIQENYKSNRGFDFQWVETDDSEKLIPLPKSLYVVIKSIKEIKFDYYEYSAQFHLVSKELLDFMFEHGFDTGFDKCEAFIVNTKGNMLTDKTFYCIRVFDATALKHREMIKLEKPISVGNVFEEQLYENVYTESQQSIFMPHLPYYPGLMVTEELENIIRQTFDVPTLYSAHQWIESSKMLFDELDF